MSDPRQVSPPRQTVPPAEECGHTWRDWRDPDCSKARAFRVSFVVVVLALVVGLVVWFA